MIKGYPHDYMEPPQIIVVRLKQCRKPSSKSQVFMGGMFTIPNWLVYQCFNHAIFSIYDVKITVKLRYVISHWFVGRLGVPPEIPGCPWIRWARDDSWPTAGQRDEGLHRRKMGHDFQSQSFDFPKKRVFSATVHGFILLVVSLKEHGWNLDVSQLTGAIHHETNGGKTQGTPWNRSTFRFLLQDRFFAGSSVRKHDTWAAGAPVVEGAQRPCIGEDL